MKQIGDSSGRVQDRDTDREALVLWLKYVRPCLQDLVSAMGNGSSLGVEGSILGPWPLGPLEGATNALLETIRAHPCPDPMLRARFELLTGRARFAALQVQSGYQATARMHWAATADRLEVLSAELERTIEDFAGD